MIIFSIHWFRNIFSRLFCYFTNSLAQGYETRGIRFRKLIININIPSYTYNKYTIALLWNMIIHRIHQLIMHHITRIFQLVKHFHKSLEMLIPQNAFYIFYYKELGLPGLDELNVSQEHLAPFIIQPKLLSTFAPRLARRTANKTITFRYFTHSKFTHILLAKICARMVQEIGFLHCGVVVVCPNNFKTSLFKT